jgi:hypothetical protein
VFGVTLGFHNPKEIAVIRGLGYLWVSSAVQTAITEFKDKVYDWKWNWIC